jgi:hypothetical protein
MTYITEKPDSGLSKRIVHHFERLTSINKPYKMEKQIAAMPVLQKVKEQE